MARTAILLVDLLGVQKMWQQGGATKVKARIEEFNEFVLNKINYLPSELHRDGEYTLILSGDSFVVTCNDIDQAVGIGIHMFTQAFYESDNASSPFWLRGAISSWKNQYLVMNTVQVSAKGLQIGTRYVSEDDYLNVLALEKSGFKGMRLIVDRKLLPSYGTAYTKLWSGFTKPLYLTCRLEQCSYPMDTAGSQFVDILWMAEKEDRFNSLRNIMAKRFKNTTRDPDEFVQAAWTRATFDQVDSLVWSCRATKKQAAVEVPPPNETP